MKLLSCGMVLFCCSTFSLPAQASYDPSDNLYRYLDVWEGRGILSGLPRIRPYSAEILRGLLSEVMQRGTANDARVAREFLPEITGTYFHPTTSYRSLWRDSADANHLSFGADAFLPLGSIASAGARIKGFLISGSPASLLPVGERFTEDFNRDVTVTIPFAGRNYEFRHDTASAISVGNESFSFQAGLSRASFGPFFTNGVVIGPQAPLSANFLANWRVPITDVVFLDSAFMDLYEGFFCLSQQLPSGSLLGGKYLLLHGAGISPFPWFSFDLFETVIWTGRFEPMYLVPAANLFYTQSLNGYGDNSFAGFSTRIRILPGLQVKGTLLFDDAFKVSAQAGLQWTPQSDLLRYLSLDYTFVTPYTYSHYKPTPSLVDDYTNWGANEGPALEPNSDRIEARIFLTPIPGLELEASGRFIRHGNASEGIAGGGDGTILDTGYVNGVPTFITSYYLPFTWEELRFLSQSVIDYSFQGGVSGTYRLKTDWGAFGISARYHLEYRINEGLAAGNDFLHQYIDLGLEYRL